MSIARVTGANKVDPPAMYNLAVNGALQAAESLESPFPLLPPTHVNPYYLHSYNRASIRSVISSVEGNGWVNSLYEEIGDDKPASIDDVAEHSKWYDAATGTVDRQNQLEAMTACGLVEYDRVTKTYRKTERTGLMVDSRVVTPRSLKEPAAMFGPILFPFGMISLLGMSSSGDPLTVAFNAGLVPVVYVGLVRPFVQHRLAQAAYQDYHPEIYGGV